MREPGEFVSGPWLRVAIWIGVAIATYVALVWSLQRSVLFPRPPVPGVDVTKGFPELRRLDVGGKRTVDAWFMPPLTRSSKFPVIVFAHGNFELIDHWIAEFRIPREWGFGVLLVEYPGYGRSQGSPSQQSIADVFVEALDRLLQEPGVDPAAIVGYGRSLGGGAICQLATQRKLSALVLESAFHGVAPLARKMGVLPWLVRDPFDNLAVIESYPGPLLLLHGTRDGIVPVAHSERLHAAAANSRLIPLECGHNDCPRIWPMLHGFLVEQGIASHP